MRLKRRGGKGGAGEGARVMKYRPYATVTFCTAVVVALDAARRMQM